MTTKIVAAELNGAIFAMIDCDLTDAEMAALPKYARPKAKRWGFTLRFDATAANGGKNESGLRKLRKIMEKVDCAWEAPGQNCYRTPEDFFAAIA